MSLLKQKLFKWKEKPKILKTEWPELVGKVALNTLLFLFMIMGTEGTVKYVCFNWKIYIKINAIDFLPQNI